jgi:radical SAM protein with 4Fe4S-binding SPASM domain
VSRRSWIGLRPVLKNLARVAPHPGVALKLARLQVGRWLLHPALPRLRAGWAGPIRQVSLRLTDRCNLRCRTCGQWGQAGYLHDPGPGQELAWTRYAELLADLAAHGPRPLVYLWGGEPLLYPGLVDLVEAATALGMPVSLATNGGRLERLARRLVEAGLFLLQVSIDGPEAELHNALRPEAGRGDNFAALQAGLAAVGQARQELGRRLPLMAALTVVSQANASRLADIYRAFQDKVDLFVFYLSWWLSPERAQAHEADFAARFGFAPRLHQAWLGDWRVADPLALAQELARLQDLARPWGRPGAIIVPHLTSPPDLRRYYADHAATFGFHRCLSVYQMAEVNANGDLSPCRDYRDYVVGNVSRQGLGELWNAESFRRFRRSLAEEGLMPVCSRCCGLMGY